MKSKIATHLALLGITGAGNIYNPFQPPKPKLPPTQAEIEASNYRIQKAQFRRLAREEKRALSRMRPQLQPTSTP